jgi:hypothetical protein
VRCTELKASRIPRTSVETIPVDRSRFADLILGYCALCGIEGAMDIVHGAPVRVDDVLFSLIHSVSIDPSLLLIYGDVGTMPQDGDARAYRALLLRNFALSARRGPVFSISPDSGRLVLAHADDLAGMTPIRLADRLEELAGHANQWRENPFDP